MLLLGLLIVLRRDRRRPRRAAAAWTARARCGAIAAVATVLCWRRSSPAATWPGPRARARRTSRVVGAHLACGDASSRPASARFCRSGTGALVDIQLTHRLFMYLTAIAVLAMAAVALGAGRATPPRLLRSLAPVLLACQILLGAINVWLGKHAGADRRPPGARRRLLWATVVYAAASLLAVPAAPPARRASSGATRRPQAATA